MVFRINIEKESIKNNNYRRIIYTDNHIQIVLMSIGVGEFIHQESHNGTQFFRIERGRGVAEIGRAKKKMLLSDGISITVPQNTLHKIINTSKTESLKIYTIYSPPQHEPNEIERRQSAD